MSGSSGLIDVRPNHRFDVAKLEAYLQQHLPGFSGPARVQQFAGGQSNPTYLLSTPTLSYVVRKKPPGQLLPSAHLVEREYRIYRSLAESDVPVPRVDLLCEDETVIGTPFFVMEHVSGRVFDDPRLPDCSSAQRRSIYLEMIRVLATLHRVDYRAQGLEDFGKPGNYFARQINRWSRQYRSAETETIASMDRLIEWLPQHMPEDDATSIVHGDYQLYNMMFHKSENRCLAVLDWELSTLGNPLADLAYNCMKYHAREQDRSVESGHGIPAEEEILQEYCRLTGRSEIENWEFCLAFSFFRMASIVQGVYKRGLQGNASSDSALTMKSSILSSANTAWEIAQTAQR